MSHLPLPAGPGIGWRPELAVAIERRADLGFVEVLAEALGPADFPALERLRDRGVVVLPHGVSLGLGGASLPDRRRIERLARLANDLGAPLVSEHVAFVRAGGREAGHLLPVPRTREMLAILVENVREAQRRLPVPLALENIAPLFDWPGAELAEADFLAELLERTDTRLLLDLANLYARACNHDEDPLAYLDRLPLERIAYVHVGGGIWREGLYHDTHAHPVPPEVLALVGELAARVPGVPLLLERDAHFPADAELWAELEAIAAHARPKEATHARSA